LFSLGSYSLDSKVYKEILDNGLVVLIKPTESRGLASLYITVKAGQRNDKKYAGSGISHLLEHMIFKGKPEDETNKLSKLVKSYGGYINASTDFDSTQYYITVPAIHILECIEVLSLAVMDPFMDESGCEREKSVILNEMRILQDDPERQLNQYLFQTAYIEHPYRFPVIGYIDIFKTLTVADLKDYHSRFYVPNNIIISVAGKVGVSETTEKIKSIFLKYSRKPDPSETVPQEPDQIIQRTYKAYMDINLGYLAIGYHSVEISDPDLYALDLLSMILGSGDASRLNASLVKDKRLLYSIGSYNFTPKDKGLFVISGVGDSMNLEEAAGIIRSEIEDIAVNGITDDEFMKTKEMAVTGYLDGLENVNFNAAIIADNEMFAGDPDFALKYIENLKLIKKEDVVNAAAKYLKDSNLSIVYLLPRAAQGAGREEYDLPDGADSPPEMVKLDNGIRVVMKKDSRVPLISLLFTMPGGLVTDPDGKSGLSDLTVKMLLKGTKSRHESEIRGAMEKLGGSISAFNSVSNAGIGMAFQPRDTKFAFDLLEDVLKNPVFPGEEMQKLKSLAVAAIRAEEDDAFSKAKYELRKGIYGSHPYGRRLVGDPADFEGINADELKDHLSKVLDAGKTVISVAGDFDRNEVLDLIGEKFGTLKATGYSPDSRDAPVIKGERGIIINMPKQEAIYAVAFNAVDIKDERKYAFDILLEVMSGSSGRIFDAVREKLGLSYAQGGRRVSMQDSGYVFFFIAVDPQDLDQAKKVLLGVIKDAVKGISEREFSDAKNSVLGKQMMALEKNGSIAYTMGMDEFYTLGFDNYKRYKENIENCKISDIINVVEEFLDEKNTFSVTILPEE